MSVWDIVVLLSKSLTYLAMMTIPGAFFVFILQRRASHQLDVAPDPAVRQRLLLYFVLPMLVIGILSVSLFFLAQVGAVNQQGIAGMLDRDMGAIMATTALGEGVQWRLNGFLVAAAAIGVMMLSARLHGYQQQLERLSVILVVLSLLMFAWSFAILGHTSVLSLSAQLAIGLHMTAVSIWVGALYPLYRLCREDDGTGALALIMADFGRAGWGFIGLLLVSGIYLIVSLTGSWEALFSSDHGRLLLLKLMLVVGMLALGSLNKFRLVPTLQDAALRDAGILKLRRSMLAEMLLAALILLVTASLTTVTGPAT